MKWPPFFWGIVSCVILIACSSETIIGDESVSSDMSDAESSSQMSSMADPDDIRGDSSEEGQSSQVSSEKKRSSSEGDGDQSSSDELIESSAGNESSFQELSSEELSSVERVISGDTYWIYDDAIEGEDSNLELLYWNDPWDEASLPSCDETNDAADGASALDCTLSPGWSGFYFGSSNAQDFSDFSDGYLVFNIKTTKGYMVKLESDNDAKTTGEIKIIHYADLSGDWEEVVIPLSEFTKANGDAKGLVLNEVTVPFALISSGNGTAVLLDGVRFEKEATSTWREVEGPGDQPAATSDEEFTLMVIPDTQAMISHFKGNSPETFRTQLRWIVSQKDVLNVKFVSHMGDLVENGGQLGEWDVASDVMTILDDSGLPYNIAAGNHDLNGLMDHTTWHLAEWDNWSNFNNAFPVSRFSNNDWYGGSFPEGQNENNYELFEGAGMEFIIIHFRNGIRDETRKWASDLLTENADKRAILVHHDPFDGVVNALAAEYAHVFMVLGGHHCSRESRETKANNFGGSYYMIMQDYQGDGYGDYCAGYPEPTANTRYFVFKPKENTIDAFTYSPLLSQFETDDSSQFSLTYKMTE